jgi:hypothetical protein
MGKRGTSADLLERSRLTYGAGVALAAIDGALGRIRRPSQRYTTCRATAFIRARVLPKAA